MIFVHGFGDPMEVSFITMEITTIHTGENNMFLEQKKPGPHFFKSKIQCQEGCFEGGPYFSGGRSGTWGVATLPEAASFIWQIQDFVNGLVIKSGDGWEGWICFFLEVVFRKGAAVYFHDMYGVQNVFL